VVQEQHGHLLAPVHSQLASLQGPTDQEVAQQECSQVVFRWLEHLAAVLELEPEVEAELQ
jgi:hypothetical protein